MRLRVMKNTMLLMYTTLAMHTTIDDAGVAEDQVEDEAAHGGASADAAEREAAVEDGHGEEQAQDTDDARWRRRRC